MSVYKIYFTWENKDMIIKAGSLDMTHPYFISLKDLIFSENRSAIIDPAKDDVKKVFGKSEHIMVPFQTVKLIEEFKDDPDNKKAVNGISLFKE